MSKIRLYYHTTRVLYHDRSAETGTNKDGDNCPPVGVRVTRSCIGSVSQVCRAWRDAATSEEIYRCLPDRVASVEETRPRPHQRQRRRPPRRPPRRRRPRRRPRPRPRGPPRRPPRRALQHLPGVLHLWYRWRHSSGSTNEGGDGDGGDDDDDGDGDGGKHRHCRHVYVPFVGKLGPSRGACGARGLRGLVREHLPEAAPTIAEQPP